MFDFDVITGPNPVRDNRDARPQPATRPGRAQGPKPQSSSRVMPQPIRPPSHNMSRDHRKYKERETAVREDDVTGRLFRAIP